MQSASKNQPCDDQGESLVKTPRGGGPQVNFGKIITHKFYTFPTDKLNTCTQICKGSKVVPVH